jgi:hypothetical protein
MLAGWVVGAGEVEGAIAVIGHISIEGSKLEIGVYGVDGWGGVEG